jgi:DNA-binding NtrC family response regulator
MTAAELINTLEKYDQDLPVIMLTKDGYLTKIKDATQEKFDYIYINKIIKEYILLNPMP